MVTGIVLILSSILLIVFPQLLSLIVAGLLMFMGVTAVFIAWHERRLNRHFRNPVIEFFIRY